MSMRSVSRPTSRAIATRAPLKSLARAALSTAHECFSKSRSAKHEYAKKISIANNNFQLTVSAATNSAIVPPTQTIAKRKNSAIPPPYPSAPIRRSTLSNQERVRPINRIGCNG